MTKQKIQDHLQNIFTGRTIPGMENPDLLTPRELAKRRRAHALKRYQDGVKFKEIGEELGITREGARQMVNKAIEEAKAVKAAQLSAENVQTG